MLRILPSVWLLFLLLFPAVARAQDEARVLAAFDKVFTPPPKGKATIDDKLAALQSTSNLDSGKTAEVLVEAWQHVADELAQVDAEREAKSAELAELIKGQEASEQRNLETKKSERYRALKPELADLRRRCDDLRTLLEKVGDRIGQLRRRDSALWLLQRVVGQKKLTLPLKLAVAKALGGAAGDVIVELAAALPKAKEPEDQIVLIDALAFAGKVAQPHVTPLVALLESKEEAVAERAALALTKIAAPETVGPVIALLARIDGQPRLRIAAALEVLTGEQFGSNVGSWQAWWQAEGANFVKSGQPLGTGKPSQRRDSDKNYYFGIPQEQSKAILYVIDCSGSMKAAVTWKGKDDAKVETTRIEACKFELTRALERLRPGQKFAILWYNDLPHFWEPKMQPATKESIARAQEFVKTLRPASSTNIHDSLEQCFKLVGRGAHDKYYGVELDTIFLMTDGSPTTFDGKLDSTEKILLGVREWNPLKRVTVHTIAMGKDLNEQFLRQLATENGGEFKQF